MSQKHVEAAKARWVGIAPEDRSVRMSKIVRIRWDKTSMRKRKEFAKRMVEGRKK